MSDQSAAEAAVSESELKQANARIRELERLLGNVAILKLAVELVSSKKLIAPLLLPGKTRGGR